MNGVISKISLTAEQYEKTLDHKDLNTDVIVRFDNGDEYVATFLSIRNFEAMLQKHRYSNEHSSKRYYKLLNGVLVNDFSSGNLLHVIEQMMAEGDFQVVFKKV